MCHFPSSWSSIITLFHCLSVKRNVNDYYNLVSKVLGKMKAYLLLFFPPVLQDSLFQEIHRPSTAQTIEIDAVCDMSRYGTSMRTVSPLGDWIPAIDRESTTDSMPVGLLCHSYEIRDNF